MDAQDARSDGKLTNARRSRTAWLNGPEEDSDAVVRRVNARLGALVGLELEGSEPLQVLTYETGGYYNPHFDWGFVCASM